MIESRPIMSVKLCLPVPVFYLWQKLIRTTLQRGHSAIAENLFKRLEMLTNSAIILYGHFHDLLGLPVPPWNFLEIAVVFTALHVMQTRYCDDNSVCLSVCLSVRPSVTRVYCDKTVERSVQIYIPYERTFSLVF